MPGTGKNFCTARLSFDNEFGNDTTLPSDNKSNVCSLPSASYPNTFLFERVEPFNVVPYDLSNP